MNGYIKRSVGLKAALLVCLISPIHGMAGEDDSYNYKLEVNNNDKVCSHMKKVYNKYFKRPFKASTDHADYEEGERYALPMLPGVKRDPRLAMQARRSLQPTSPEFDAIKWKEGRYNIVIAGKARALPILVAEIDIDNNGTTETVIKESFMEGYLPSYRSMFGGRDSLFIFRAGELDINKPIQQNTFYEGQEGHRSPALIGGFGYPFSSRLIRLFTYDGVNYLSAYSQAWLKEDADPYQPPDREVMEVLQYHGGGDNLSKGKWSPLAIDTICQFRMTVAK